MKKSKIIQLLTKSWHDLEDDFKSTKLLCENDQLLLNMYKLRKTPISAGGYCKYKSPIRVFGSESYLQTKFYEKISKNLKLLSLFNMKYILTVEGSKRYDKKPDILLWKPNNDLCIWEKGMKPDTGQKELIFQIELKVTGYYLINEKSKWDNYYKDIVKYHNDDSITRGNTLFMFACYYEGNPNDILEITNHGRTKLVQWIEEKREITFNNNFKSNLIEAFGFRGKKQKWVIIP